MRLSAIAQCVGYVICAIEPLLVGLLHHADGSWITPLAILLALLVPQLVFGALSPRVRTLA